ncbi:MAG: serine/threonine-protein kinase [Planctomycetota bacterium]|nr:serine/threonine-protein kinase [Planctomycetota bacterium]
MNSSKNADPDGDAETLDAIPKQSAKDDSPKPVSPGKAAVEFVVDATDSPMRALLHRRVRTVAMVLCMGGAMFLFRGIFIGSPEKVIHTTVVLASAACFLLLRGERRWSVTQLRRFQLVIFGMTFAFFAIYQHALMLQEAEKGNAALTLAAFKTSSVYWLLLVFFGMIIPAGWKRAALTFGPLAFVLPLTALYTSTCHPLVAEVLIADQVLDTAMSLGLGSFCAVFGTHIINSLQEEVFEGRELGQYKLLKRLGEGGMGEVHLAQHRLLARPCAIKLIKPEQAGDPTALMRFEREVQATAQLSHWNTIDIYDYGVHEDGTFYYVMEYLPGLNLQELVECHGPLPAGRAIHLVRQTCQALNEAHSHGLLHRDIKASNIIVTERGGVHDVAKLLDFGLVKSKMETPDELSAPRDIADLDLQDTLTAPTGTQTGMGSMDTNLTMAGTVTGTPQYMSPEQTTGIADERSDIYSVGSVLFLLTTGRVPFREDNVLKTVLALRSKPAPRPSSIRADIPPDLEAVIEKALAKKPEDRFQSAADLDAALAACAAAGEWTSREAAAWWAEVEIEDLEESTDQAPAPGAPQATLAEGFDLGSIATGQSSAANAESDSTQVLDSL